jgi:hypothetical protein
MTDGSFRDELDHWLEGVEGKANASYEQLLAGRIPQGQDRADFSTFVSSLYVRSPAMLHAAAEGKGKMMQQTMNFAWGTRERFEKSLDRFDRETGNLTADRDKLWEFFHDKGGYVVQVDHLAGLAVVGASDRIQEVIFHRHWTLLDAAEGFFITSDAPVQRFTPRDAHYGSMGDGGFLNPACEVTVPLSPTRALLVTGEPFPQSRYFLTGSHVHAFNQQRAAGARRYIYADRKSPAVETLAVAHKDDGPSISVGSEKRMAKVEVVRSINGNRASKED